MGHHAWTGAAAIAAPAAGAAAGALAWRHARSVDWTAWELDDALAVGAGALGAVAAAWFTLSVIAALAARLRGAAPPRWTGTLARATAGALAAALLGTQAHAAETPDIPSPGWLAISVTSTAPPAPADAPAPEPPAESTDADASADQHSTSARLHTVVPGDTLWAIAAGALGDTTTDAETATAWPAIYQENREIIGGDPDLILPGMELRIPAHLTEAEA